MNCEDTYVSGYRRGQPCPYRASNIIAAKAGAMHRVCGYHARAYAPSVVYPLDWSLARIRAWRVRNLDNLLRDTGS